MTCTVTRGTRPIPHSASHELPPRRALHRPVVSSDPQRQEESMFFAPPRTIETQVFARLPAELQDADQDNEWVAGQPLGMHAGSLIEGPSFDREGNLWCVDVPNGRVYTVGRDGRFTMRVQYDGWPNGLKIHRDGRIFITDHKHGLMVLDRDTGKVTPWLERCNVERFKGVN